MWRWLPLIALLSTGCEIKKEDKNEDYSYQYNENGCDTGKQTFKSQSAYCDGLKDESLNHGCAVQTRLKTWENECK